MTRAEYENGFLISMLDWEYVTEEGLVFDEILVLRVPFTRFRFLLLRKSVIENDGRRDAAGLEQKQAEVAAIDPVAEAISPSLRNERPSELLG